MTALIVIGAILAIISLILFIPVGIYVKWDGEVALSLVVGFVKVRLMPKKEKKIRLRDFSKRNYEKMLRREEKKKRKAEEKAAKKPAKSKKSKAESASAGEKEDTAGKSSAVRSLWQLRRIITDIVVNFTHHIHTKAVKIDVAVGAQDAAKCAILYGVVSQFCVFVMEFLSANTKLDDSGDINVRADFSLTEIAADVEIVFRSRVVHALGAAVRFAVSYAKKLSSVGE